MHYLRKFGTHSPGVHQVDPGLGGLHVYEVLREALQLGLELDNQLHGGAHIHVVVVGLGCGLEAAQDGPAIRVGAVDDDYLSPAEQITERLNKSVSQIWVHRFAGWVKWVPIEPTFV